MNNNERKYKSDDFQEQYDILVEEEQEKQKKKAFWLIFVCLGIILLSVLGATYSYYRVYTTTDKKELNIDTNGDGIPDLNVDLNNNGKCDINCDIDGDGKPDINIDYEGDLKAHFNIDTNNDEQPDRNLINQKNGNGMACELNGNCDLNCDTNNDNRPDINIDIDGDGNPDINIDTDCDGLPDLNLDTNGDGKADERIDTNGDGICDLNCGNEEPPQVAEPEPQPEPQPEEPKQEEPKVDDPILDVRPSEDNESGILYVTYVKGVNVENMLPGEENSVTQTFTVENHSSQTIIFNLNWLVDLNEISTTSDGLTKGFTYSIKRDGIAVKVNDKTNIPLPRENGAMLSNIIISAGTTYKYEITYTFHNLENVDQTMDQNKTFRAKITAEIVQ